MGLSDGKWSCVEEESGYEPQEGICFAWPAGASCENTYIYQDDSLSGHKAGDSIIFNVMVCNYGQLPHDMERVELQFLDASGKQLKNFTQDQRNPDWNQQTIIATIPTGAASARVVLRAIWYVSGDVDAYYDDTSVVVTSEKYNMVYVTEKTDRETAAAGDVLTLTYEKPAVFADDANISFWAKDRVYFMAANKIIKGVGNNKFAPKNVTSAEEANGYANATREQALIITVRMVQNLG